MLRNYIFRYENQEEMTYLVYDLKQGDALDSMSLGMLTHNNINGFVPILFTQMDTTKILKYNISGCISLNQMFREKMKKNQILSVFLGILDAFSFAEDYMVDSNLILLDEDYIYTDSITNETKVICVPVLHESDVQNDLKLFFKKLMFRINFDTNEKSDYVVKIVNYLNAEKSFSIVEFKRLLEELRVEVITVKTEPVEKKELKPRVEKVVINPILEEICEPKKEEKQMSLFYLLQHYSKENAAIYKAQRKTRKQEKVTNKGVTKEQEKSNKNGDFEWHEFSIPGEEGLLTHYAKMQDLESMNFEESIENNPIDLPQGEEMDFGETILLEDDETVLAEVEETELSKTEFPYLLKLSSNDKVYVNKDIFKIGKDKSYADYVIDLPVISHKHAYIISRGKSYYLVDTNSKNHTYVNEERLLANIEKKLENGSKICFAREEYEFYLH